MMCSNSLTYERLSSTDRPCSRAQSRASRHRPCAASTRARSAGTGRTFGREVAQVHPLRLVEQGECAGQIALGFPDSGHRDPPPVGVLRQPGVLAQLLAAEQVLGGGVQIAAFAGDLAHAHVHVRRSAEHGPGFLGGELQGPLERAQRVAQATLGACGCPPA